MKTITVYNRLSGTITRFDVPEDLENMLFFEVREFTPTGEVSKYRIISAADLLGAALALALAPGNVLPPIDVRICDPAPIGQ